MPTVDVLGHPTWYTVQGSGEETVLLLHGGMSCSALLLDSIGGPLSASTRVAAFDRRGHGRTADTSEAFHYDAMVDETIEVIEHLGGPVHIVGWSDGGIVGVLLGLRRPDLIGRLVLIGANFHWNALAYLGFDAARNQDPAAVAGPTLTAQYAQLSPDGPDHWPVVIAKTLDMWCTEPELSVEDLSSVTVPVLLMSGDDDVPLGHLFEFFAAVPEAQLAIVPGASHALPIEHPREVVGLIERFLRSEIPPVTMMPDRRR